MLHKTTWPINALAQLNNFMYYTIDFSQASTISFYSFLECGQQWQSQGLFKISANPQTGSPYGTHDPLLPWLPILSLLYCIDSQNALRSSLILSASDILSPLFVVLISYL